MRLSELIELCERTHRRYQVARCGPMAVLAALDVEGRLFAALEGNLVHLVRTGAFFGTSSGGTYLNPGGDGLWPAPEGSRLGYEYATGAWRVPPGLTGARYAVLRSTPHRMAIRAEIDLVNSEGLGVPAAFERDVVVEESAMVVTETIEYLGPCELPAHRCRLAPWSLAQFAGGPGCVALFPDAGPGSVRDLYEPSDSCRRRVEGVWETATDGSARYQLGLSPDVEWIEMRNPATGLRVRRTAAPLPAGQEFLDIADVPPDRDPLGPPVRFSVYSDTSGFLELEAAGGCPEILRPGDRLRTTIRTEFGRTEGTKPC